MYTIFFTINCVEQLTFYKAFVDQLQFKQLIFFCLKLKLLEIHVRQMIFDFQPVFTFFVNCLTCVEQLIFLCRPVFLSYLFLSSWSSPCKLTSQVCKYYHFLFKLILQVVHFSSFINTTLGVTYNQVSTDIYYNYVIIN